jgi:hypothetical protein
MSRFEIITTDELIRRLKAKGRKYKWAQLHHTWKPNHSHFNGKNHISMQEGMHRHHTQVNGWDDIGQHVTLMPDGLWVTGRDFASTPAGIKGYNTGAFMVEIVGDFDKGRDKLEGAQLEEALQFYSFLLGQGSQLMFHREHAAKSCPGTGLDKAQFLKQVKEWTEEKRTAPGYEVKPMYNDQSILLKFGDKSALVKKFQTYLIELGYDLGEWGADSDYGRATTSAVEKFQKDHKLTVDGVIGRNTSAAIQKALEEKRKPKALPKDKVPEKSSHTYRLAHLQDTASLDKVKELKEKGYIIIDVPKED